MVHWTDCELSWGWFIASNFCGTSWLVPLPSNSPEWRLIGNPLLKNVMSSWWWLLLGREQPKAPLFRTPQKPSSDSTQFSSPYWLPHLSEVPMVEWDASPKQLAGPSGWMKLEEMEYFCVELTPTLHIPEGFGTMYNVDRFSNAFLS